MIRQRAASDFDSGLESQMQGFSVVTPTKTSRYVAHIAFRWRLLLALSGIILFGWFFIALSKSHYPVSPGATWVAGGVARKHDVPRSNLGNVALVFLAHDRPEYLRDSLRSVFAANGLDRVDLIVSMDHEPNFAVLRGVVEEFATPDRPITLWDSTMPNDMLYHSTDDHISTHHRQVFDRSFAQNASESIEYDFGIILETDLTVSPDFFDYMFSVGHLLHPVNPSSSSLFCISAWNDNGFEKYDLKEDRLFRTDFYPGLGWMIHKSAWQQVLSKEWPSSTANVNYDWWMRDSSSFKDKDCICPEVPRTHHVAKFGAHVNGEDSYNFYASMLFASGRHPVTSAEVSVIGDLTAYENRVKREKFTNVKYLHNLESGWKVPFGQNIVVFANDQDPEAPNFIRKVAEAAGTWGEFRGRHKGLQSLALGPQFGHTNVTIVTERMRSYWEL